MKLAAYLRVSTDRQAERGFGLAVQEQAVRAWGREHGHRIVAVYRDEGVSGSNGLESREALPVALRELRGGRAGGLVVARLDRLARDLVLQETILAQLWANGWELFSAASGEADLRDDDTDPSRKLIRQILGAVAEYERSLITMRMQNGRRAKAERGGFAYGAPAYGWRSDGGELVPVPAEQEVIRRVRKLHRAGISMREVARRMNAEEVPTKRPGGQWDAKQIGRVLSR